MTTPVVMYEEEYAQLKTAITRLCADANAKFVFLVDKNGQQIAAHGHRAEPLHDLVARRGPRHREHRVPRRERPRDLAADEARRPRHEDAHAPTLHRSSQGGQERGRSFGRSKVQNF